MGLSVFLSQVKNRRELRRQLALNDITTLPYLNKQAECECPALCMTSPRLENPLIHPCGSHLIWSKLGCVSHVVTLRTVEDLLSIQEVFICLPLYHFLPLLLLSCLSYSSVTVSKGRLLGPEMRGLCCATEINAPQGMICLVHVCLAGSTLIQGATEHVRDRTAQWRFICLSIRQVSDSQA